MNAELLRLLGLPEFDNLDALAAAMNLPSYQVATFVSRANYHYRRRFIPKRNGGRRLIAEPNPILKAIQAWILRAILDKLHPSSSATGYVRGRTLLDNVRPHAGHRYFLCVDVADFFPSIRLDAVMRIFSTIGYHDEVAVLLSKLCCFRDRLPQGGVTSPSLSNLKCFRLDRALALLAASRAVTYTRYADDLTFSANNPNSLRGLLQRVQRELSAEGFRVNYRKVKILGPSKRCRITGLTKHSAEPRFSIGTAKKRQLRSIMHRVAVGRPVEGPYQTVESIEGWLAFLKGHDATSFNQMSRYWRQIRGRADFSRLIHSVVSVESGEPAPGMEGAILGPLDDLEVLFGGQSVNSIRVHFNAIGASDGRLVHAVRFSYTTNTSPDRFPRILSLEVEFAGGLTEVMDESALDSLVGRVVWQQAVRDYLPIRSESS